MTSITSNGNRVKIPAGASDFKLFIDYINEHHSPPDIEINGNFGRYHEIAVALAEVLKEDGYKDFEVGLNTILNTKTNPYHQDVMVALSAAFTDESEPEQDKYLQFLEFGDLKTLPPPEWLVYRFLPTKGVNFIYGPAGEGKTYMAVSLAVSIASEQMDSWLGLAIRHGHVIYIAAEDIDEVAQRFIGCATYYHLQDIPNLHIFPASLQLVKDTPKLIDSIKHRYGDIKVAMFFFDTLAMCSLGIEENSKKDFDAVTASLEVIWREFDCGVTAIHHSGRNGEIRGTSSMDGVAYSMIKVSKSDERVQVHSTKARRGKGFEDFYLDWVTVDVQGIIDEMGEQATTGVLIRSDRGNDDSSKITKFQRTILEHIQNFGVSDVSRSEVMKACQIERNSEKGFINAVSALIGKGLLRMSKEKQRTYYSITETGLAVLAESTATC